MQHKRWLGILFFFVVPSFVPSWAGAEGASANVTVLGQLPNVEMVRISPSSKYLALVRTNGERLVIKVFGMTEKAYVYGVQVAGQKLRDMKWVDDERLLIETSTTAFPPAGLIGARREWFVGQVVNVKTKRDVPLTFTVKDTPTLNVLGSLTAVRRVKDRNVIFAEGYFQSNHTFIPGLFTVDPDSGASRLIAEAHGGYASWLIDADGTVRAALEYDQSNKKWSLRVRKDGWLSVVATGVASIDVPQLAGLTDDPNVAVLEDVDEGIQVYKRLSLVDGSILGEYEPGRGMSRLFTARLSPRIIGGFDSAAEQLTFFDAGTQQAWSSIRGVDPGAHLQWISNSDDFRQWVVAVTSATEGYGYHFFDLDTRHGSKLMDIYDGLPAIAERRAISYKAADGLTIPAILTLPPGREAKNLPLVVLPHGGPEARTTPNFDWWPEALALEGYAVLEPNFRGSTVSLAQVQAGYGEWGQKMQTDLSDGVRELVKQGKVDAKRVCIVGASYGGYAALAGPTLDPGVYRCAVSVAGISDMGRFLDWINSKHLGYDNLAARYFERFAAAKGPDDQHLRDISPVHHVANVTVPILLIHGKDDTVVPFDQSEVMRDALTKAGKSVEFVTLKGEDHWLSMGATRRQMLQATVNFLKANNPPD